jgi:phosphoribosylglycinamide formyltransferase-1
MNKKGTVNIAFLASHGGTNMQAVIDACKDDRLSAHPCAVISNNACSTAIQRAQHEGIPHYILNSKTHPDDDERDAAIVVALEKHQTTLIVLAGYMKKIGPKTLQQYQGRIINIHPALLPKFGGKGMYGRRVHEAVLQAGETETGVTIHLIDAEYDTGPVLAQTPVLVLKDDTVESLAERVLQKEHHFLVETLGRIVSGNICLKG